jgi:hypothetical protein
MKFEEVKDLDTARFRRLTGVKKETFVEMVKILDIADCIKKRKGGRKNKLSIPNQLLMTLKYMRHYPTQAVLAIEYGISEGSVCKGIKWVENVLVKDGIFALPGKKALLNDNSFELILVDASETPIERPKKNKDTITQGKRKGTH